jgi:putative N6-adenine-specific DNA methylase
VLFAVAAPGLEPVLLEECRRLPEVAPGTVLRASVVKGGVELEGGAGLHRAANLWLRTASRVYLRLGQVKGRDAHGLGAALGKLPFQAVVDPSTPLTVSVVGRGPVRSDALERLVAERWGFGTTRPATGASSHSTPRGEEEGAGVLLRWAGDSLEVSVDTSGEPLHRRGYRQEGSRAPIRETLAAGVLGLAGYKGEGPVVDPLCGSGTLLIEAALWAQGLAPGARRTFRFQRWPGFDAAGWARELAQAQARPSSRDGESGGGSGPVAPGAQLEGSDLNAGALGTARRNAKRAGVFEALKLERQDALSLPPHAGPLGLVVSNLPYGKRVGERGALTRLYQGLVASLARAFPGWRLALLAAPGHGLETALGAWATQVLPLRNGGLPCVLCLARLPSSGSPGSAQGGI